MMEWKDLINFNYVTLFSQLKYLLLKGRKKVTVPSGYTSKFLVFIVEKRVAEYVAFDSSHESGDRSLLCEVTFPYTVYQKC